ncbi:MAG: hypothetical protein QOK05_1864 [Chloroflexota bacterium]|jgi:hypothetical protein|nr:hypothetical protein [Chloroflexota bacterium]
MIAVSQLRAAPLEGPEVRVAAAGAGLLGAAWVLPSLWARGVNPVPPCLFHQVTGQPCPFCGGTRSFAAMAHGNLAAAVHVYPVGPLMFLLVAALVVYSAWAVASGRRIRVDLDDRLKRGLLIGVVVVLALNWASKLFVLGY